MTFNSVGVGWPWQEHAWRGLQEPQDPWTLPHAKSSAERAGGAARRSHRKALERAAGAVGAWHLALERRPGLEAGGERLSQPDYDDSRWYPAVVPGTVLTTLIARGVYPDPDYGLNNLAIPDSLSRQDYWYRSVFDAPAELQGKELTLTFKGINYAAEVWLNGARLGHHQGRVYPRCVRCYGKAATRPAQCACGSGLAAASSRHSARAIDCGGSRRKRRQSGDRRSDLHRLRRVGLDSRNSRPQHRTSGRTLNSRRAASCGCAIRTWSRVCRCRAPMPPMCPSSSPLRIARRPRSRALSLRGFDTISVQKTLSLAPGITEVTLDPREFPQLHLTQPRLWWPNGYGPANLHRLKLEVLRRRRAFRFNDASIRHPRIDL